MNAFGKYLLLVLIAVGALGAEPKAYKLVLASYETLAQANAQLETLQTQLGEPCNDLRRSHRFDLVARPSGKLFIVVIEPIADTQVAKQLRANLRPFYPDAFISRYHGPTPRHGVPTPEPISSPVAANTPAPDTPIMAKTIPAQPLNDEITPSSQAFNEMLTHPLLWIGLLFMSMPPWLYIRRRRHVAQRMLDVHAQARPLPPETTRLRVDVNPRLLPDLRAPSGPKTLDESVELVRALHAMGYRKIIAAPAVSIATMHEDAQHAVDTLNSLRTKLHHEGIDVIIELAARYRIDRPTAETIRDIELISFDRHFILVEAAGDIDCETFRSTLSHLIRTAHRVVWIHPERCRIDDIGLESYHRFKTLGVWFELDLLSLSSGHAAPTAAALIEQGMVDFLGSGMTHPDQSDALRQALETARERNLFGTNTVLNNYL